MRIEELSRGRMRNLLPVVKSGNDFESPVPEQRQRLLDSPISTLSQLPPVIISKSSMYTQGKKRKRPEVINGAILAVNLAKDAAETTAILSPLKASMGILVTLLESIKASQWSQSILWLCCTDLANTSGG
jgi:hypothetical protein